MKANHFFKVVTSSNVQHNKLRIPRKFIDEHGNNFRDSVLLKVPTGAVWLVELISSNGDVWLCSGWKRFAESYSIRAGHLLVFKYRGYSNFNVIIFDMSATEIEYPFIGNHDGQNIRNSCNNLKASVKEEVEEDGFVQVSEDFPMTDNLKPAWEVKKDNGKHTSAIGSGNSGALQRAKAFKSNKPFFMVHMGRSYVSGTSCMSIPTAFSEKYLSKVGSNVILQVSSGRTWSARCSFENGRKKRYRLSMKMFAMDNDLKTHDVCVFEMINHVEPRLTVHIFRALG